MVKVRVIKKFDDIVLEKRVLPDFAMEVTPERAKKLTSMGLCEIIKIDKLSKKEYEAIKG